MVIRDPHGLSPPCTLNNTPASAYQGIDEENTRHETHIIDNWVLVDLIGPWYQPRPVEKLYQFDTRMRNSCTELADVQELNLYKLGVLLTTIDIANHPSSMTQTLPQRPIL